VEVRLLLADLQASLARDIVAGTATGRLRVHARHFAATLVRTLLDRFPATTWLVGTPFLSAAALAFVRAAPPARPCLAEYGEQFPAFLEGRPHASAVPYLRDFAELEWRVGEVAVETARPPVAIDSLASIGDAAADASLVLQGGLRYVATRWPVADLMTLYLTDTAPDRLALAPQPEWVEVRGARGDVSVTRLSPGSFAFRRALHAGHPLAEALAAGAAREPAFDPGAALAALFAAGLVRSVQ
jgi:hypothetical protein